MRRTMTSYNPASADYTAVRRGLFIDEEPVVDPTQLLRLLREHHDKINYLTEYDPADPASYLPAKAFADSIMILMTAETWDVTMSGCGTLVPRGISMW